MNGADLEMVATLLAAKHLDALKLKDWTLDAFSLYQMGQLDDPAVVLDWENDFETSSELVA